MSITELLTNPVDELLNRYRSDLLDFDQLQNEPEPSWLIDGFLLRDSVGFIWGDSGTFKTFVVVDMAMSVATGTRWFDRPVSKGNVLYVVGEGLAGMKLRVNAWTQHHYGIRPHGEQLLFLRRPFRLLEDHATEVITKLAAEQGGVSLIVIDTLSRAIAGHDENNNPAMSRLIDISEEIREETKATILYVHHATKSSDKQMRGASALKDNVNTVIQVTRDEGETLLHCRKQKDAAPFSDTAVVMKPVGRSLVPTPESFRRF